MGATAGVSKTVSHGLSALMSSGENAELGIGRGSRVREVYTGALERLYLGAEGYCKRTGQL